jgi:hypothetical protein
MKWIKKSTLFSLTLLVLVSCTTFQFLPEVQTDPGKDNGIREYSLSYQYKVMGIDLSGKKSLTEGYFIHPDGIREFFLISFPKIGILSTSDHGKSFTHQFFSSKSLETRFGFIREDEDRPQNQDEPAARYFSLFASGRKNPTNLIITFGSYLFYSNNYGQSWKMKTIFMDQDKSLIRKIEVTPDDALFLITENKVVYSSDWFRSFTVRYPRSQGIPPYLMDITDAVYDESQKRLFLSIRSADEPHSRLSGFNYDYFYLGKTPSSKSGIYYSEDLGKTVQSAGVPALCLFVRKDSIIYAAPYYPLYFYLHPLPENLSRTTLILTGKSVYPDPAEEELIRFYETLPPESFCFNPPGEIRLVKVNQASPEPAADPSLDHAVFKAAENNPSIQWREQPLNRLADWRPAYDLAPYTFFKVWTGMKTGGPFQFAENGPFKIRMRPETSFLKDFIRYSLTQQFRLNRINPFLRKKDDHEFYDPARDPTGGFPVVIEISGANKADWTPLTDFNHVRAVIDPIGNKRSAYYWIRNFEQKRSFKLQLSFGLDQGISYFNYPREIHLKGSQLVIMMNYFTIGSDYRDLYQINLSP